MVVWLLRPNFPGHKIDQNRDASLYIDSLNTPTDSHQPTHTNRLTPTDSHQSTHTNRLTPTDSHQPTHTNRLTPTDSHQPTHTNRLTPTDSHQPIHTNRLTPTDSHQPTHTNRLTPTDSHQPTHTNRLTPTDSHQPTHTNRLTPTANEPGLLSRNKTVVRHIFAGGHCPGGSTERRLCGGGRAAERAGERLPRGSTNHRLQRRRQYTSTSTHPSMELCSVLFCSLGGSSV